MKKFIFILMLIFQSGIVESADFNVFGNSLYVTGHIDDGDYHKFKKITEANKINNLKISSMGGAVDEAIKIGLEINLRGYDVEVFGVCASSCANYIFTAGLNKKISKNSLVIWHGSPSDKCAHTIPDVQNMGLNEVEKLEFKIYYENVRKMSDDFFDFLKIDSRITCLDKKYLDKYLSYDGYTMWSNAMKQFGIRNLSDYRPIQASIKVGERVIFNFKSKKFIF